MDHDEPGFWEANGYHNRGDPWKEQRYWSGLTPVEQKAPGRWQIGTVAAIKQETPRVKSFRSSCRCGCRTCPDSTTTFA